MSESQKDSFQTKLLLAVIGLLVVIIFILLGWKITKVQFFGVELAPPATSTIESLATVIPQIQPSTVPPVIEPQPTTPITVIQTPIASDCLSTDYIPEITGFHPPIDTLICIPSSVFVYISSDPARITIPSINYDKTFSAGYTFKFFGPIKFIISGVSTKYIWMEARYDTNLLTKLDEKSLNLVYQNGKVCDLALYTGSGCP